MTDTPLQAAFTAATASFEQESKRVLSALRNIGAVVREMQAEGMDIGFEARPGADGWHRPPDKNEEPPAANGIVTIGDTKLYLAVTRWGGVSSYIGSAQASQEVTLSGDEEIRKTYARNMLLKAKAEIDTVSACSVPADGRSRKALDKPRPGLLKI